MPKKQKGNPPPPLFLVSFSVILRLEKKKKRGTRLQWGMKGEPRSPPPYFDADAVSQQVCSAPPWKRGEKNPINGIPLGRRKKLFFACFASASAVIAVHKFAFRPLSIRGRSEFDGRGRNGKLARTFTLRPSASTHSLPDLLSPYSQQQPSSTCQNSKGGETAWAL